MKKRGSVWLLLLLYVKNGFYLPLAMAEARFSSRGRSSFFIRLLMVTMGSMSSMSFICWRRVAICLPATGAQLPFSMMATRRRW